MAADALGIRQFSEVLARLIAYIPSIIAAILILAALLADDFLAGIVRGATGSDTLASIGRYAIIIYAILAALTELGIAVQLTAPTILIILGAIALAAAIAFGFGAQGVVTSDGSHTITFRYTHQQLASMVGSNREAVTRAFGNLRKAGAVELRNRQIYVTDAEALSRLAETGR
jgi:hypothetical protein